jgi:opacity protein-like surface antigen
MKRLFLFTSVIAVFLFPISLYAQPSQNNFYVGVGGSYAIENFDGDWDNSLGFNGKFGYHFHPLLDFEFDFNWLKDFEANESGSFAGDPVALNAELEIKTYMLVLKGYFPIPSDYAKLSVLLGGGLMRADATADITSPLFSGSFSGHETDICAKIGLGFDYYLIPNISLGFEANYTAGFDDLDDIEYYNFTFGAAYHF